MKILMVNRTASQEGGVERYLVGLSRELSRHGVGVSLVFGEGQPDEYDGSLSSRHLIPGLWAGSSATVLDALESIQEILEVCSPDVAYIHDLDNGAVTCHLASRLPVVKYVHGHKETCPDGKRLLQGPAAPCTYPLSKACFARAYTRRCMPRSPQKALRAYRRSSQNLEAVARLPLVLVASEFMKETVRLNGVVEEKIRVLPYFCRWKSESWQPPARQKGLLFSGRLVSAKGISALLDMLLEMDPDVTLDIVGEGPERAHIDSRIRALSLQRRVTSYGWLDGEELKDRYRHNAVLVVPSLWPEPFGMVGIEAASLCRPVVAFDVGGISDWLRDGRTGCVVEAGQFGELRTRIESLFDHPEMAKQMGLAGSQEVAHRFSAEAHVRDLVSQLERIRVEGSRS